ncbi:hypothetical protein ACFZAR_00855 [Streptomyces sp. NPDC008222]|uniref:hypothetical protein n=1 Tax=Streptomyces sp. NPDC008222 TaxID=3364820 RepID=UPI0036E796BA
MPAHRPARREDRASTAIGRCCDVLGKASYCVYVLHRPLGALVYAAALQFTGRGLEAFAPGAVWCSWPGSWQRARC